MKILVQRSKDSRVLVNNVIVGEISHGLVLFVCLEKGDNLSILEKGIEKIKNLRIFEDPVTQKMSLNINQVQGQILCISQFTLSWDGKNGHRPSFDRSLDPKEAHVLFQIFLDKLNYFVPTQSGKFAAEMEVQIKNDGPVTFFLSFP